MALNPLHVFNQMTITWMVTTEINSHVFSPVQTVEHSALKCIVWHGPKKRSRLRAWNSFSSPDWMCWALGNVHIPLKEEHLLPCLQWTVLEPIKPSLPRLSKTPTLVLIGHETYVGAMPKALVGTAIPAIKTRNRTLTRRNSIRGLIGQSKQSNCS